MYNDHGCLREYKKPWIMNEVLSTLTILKNFIPGILKSEKGMPYSKSDDGEKCKQYCKEQLDLDLPCLLRPKI